MIYDNCAIILDDNFIIINCDNDIIYDKYATVSFLDDNQYYNYYYQSLIPVCQYSRLILTDLVFNGLITLSNFKLKKANFLKLKEFILEN